MKLILIFSTLLICGSLSQAATVSEAAESAFKTKTGWTCSAKDISHELTGEGQNFARVTLDCGPARTHEVLVLENFDGSAYEEPGILRSTWIVATFPYYAFEALEGK